MVRVAQTVRYLDCFHRNAGLRNGSVEGFGYLKVIEVGRWFKFMLSLAFASCRLAELRTGRPFGRNQLRL